MNKSFYLNKLNKLSSFEIFSIPKFRYAEINYKHNFSFSEKTPSKNQNNNERDLYKSASRNRSRSVLFR